MQPKFFLAAILKPDFVGHEPHVRIETIRRLSNAHDFQTRQIIAFDWVIEQLVIDVARHSRLCEVGEERIPITSRQGLEDAFGSALWSLWIVIG